MTATLYHYTESGLENIWLAGGYEFVDSPNGQRQVVIHDIDGLHKVIGRMLVDDKKDLSGKEVRFLRQAMLMSQGALAKLLEVSEQAVHRWEKGKTGQVPKPAEALIRLLYREVSGDADSSHLRVLLKRFAEMENAIDGMRITASKAQTDKPWKLKIASRAELGTGV